MGKSLSALSLEGSDDEKGKVYPSMEAVVKRWGDNGSLLAVFKGQTKCMVHLGAMLSNIDDSMVTTYKLELPIAFANTQTVCGPLLTAV